MAKITRPLLSFSAAGSIGQQIIYQGTKKTAIARRWFAPAQPRPANIVARRDKYRTAVNAWNALTSLDQQTWTVNAKPLNLTGYNLFLSVELKKIPSGTTWDAGATTWDTGATTWD